MPLSSTLLNVTSLIPGVGNKFFNNPVLNKSVFKTEKQTFCFMNLINEQVININTFPDENEHIH